jgi:hypothetical protein
MNGGSPQDSAESCRERAARYRRAIERAERWEGRRSDPRWPEIKAILLELAEDLEREADVRAAEEN